jgi:SAM-dependent methyltransferase
MEGETAALAQKRLYDPDWRDRWFEWRHGIDVEAKVPHERLSATTRGDIAFATSYQPMAIRTLKAVHAAAAGTGIAFRRFVDIGCGKGKACLWTARTGRFRSCLGIDFSAELVAIAERNRQIFPSPVPVEFRVASARDYRLPDETSLVFLFNPFDDEMLDLFLACNAAHFRRRRSVIAYVYDLHRGVLETHGFRTVHDDPKRRLSLHRIM